MATNTEFTIIRGKTLEFTIIVKANGLNIPLVLTLTDTFTFSLVDKKTSVKYITDKPMTLTDLLNGKVTGHITSVESASLPIKKAAAEDGYVARPNLRLVINGNTLNQGEMTAMIEDVYVVIG